MNKSRVFLAAMLLIPILSIEAIAYLSTIMYPQLYDYRDATIARLDEREYMKFIKYAADTDMGWDQSIDPKHEVRQNCRNEKTIYTDSPNRIRNNNSDFDALDAPVVVAGDSFTYGTDVDDNKTYPAFLEKILGVPVANLGVGGYDPLQSLLKLQKKIDLFPHAQVVVLGIMYSDLLRMLNSDRLVYYGDTKNMFGLKPYMKNGEIIPLPPGIMDGFSQMQEATRKSFDSDYWAKPVASFPYTYSFVKALTSNAFRMDILIAVARMRHQPDYHYIMDMPDLQTSYISLLHHYADFAKAHGLKPVLVLIPANVNDATTGDILIGTAKQSFGDTFTYVPVGAGIDWAHYIRHGAACDHPSPYGYEMIAEAVAKGVKEAGLH